MPEPTVLPLASGKQFFGGTSAATKTFKIIKAEFDPLDVKQGEKQIVRVFVEDTEERPITYENGVEATVFTDNKSVQFSFKLRKISDANADTLKGILTEWEGAWVLDDSYDKIYVINITAKSAEEEDKLDLTFR